MINLLPAKEKKELAMEVIQKKVLIILIFVSVFFLCLILILVAIKVYISSEADAFRKLVQEEEKEFKTSQFGNFEEVITKNNENLAKIKKLWQDQILFTLVFERLSSLTPKTIYFTSFSLKKNLRKKADTGGEEIFAEVHISGVAATRETLFSFKKSLEAENDLEDIYFLPSSWIEPTNADFSLTFNYIKPPTD